MGTSQQFSLRWNNYLKHITSAFDTLRSDEDLVDVTLSCEGKRIRAHKMLLSACSTYFRDLFKENPCQHPVIIFRNVKFDDLAALVDFIYQGEVNVVQEQLDSFMTTAELLAVQGLTDGSRKEDSITEDDVEIPNEPEVQLRNAPGKVVMNNKGSKSPNSPSPYHSSDAKSDPPPNKKRRCRDNADSHSERSKRRAAASPKNPDNGKSDGQPSADPVEIIPLMPNLKLEMPEYLEQDGSSCSYDEHGGDSPSKTIGDGSDIIEDDQKPDITNTFYSNASDTLDASKSSDIGYILSKPGTSSGDRISHEGLGAVSVGRKRRQVTSLAASSTDSSSTSIMSAPSTGTSGTISGEGQVVMQGPSRFSCSLCGSVYRHLASLTQHLEVHRNQTTCLLCHTTLSRRTDLRRHMRLKHNMQWQKSMHRHRNSRRELNNS